jgi:hypothetical protein
MTPELRAFLTATDLDELWSARAKIAELDSQDLDEIDRVLQEWADAQAVANILMYPDLIPTDIRLHYMLQGLLENKTTYFVLAATVGLYRIDIEILSVDEQAKIVDQLIAVMKDHDGPIADRASVFLADKLLYLEEDHTTKIVGLLDLSSDLVRHNILVALIPLVGLENIRGFLDTAVETDQMSEAARLSTEKKLSGIAGFSDTNTVDGAQLDLGSLNTPLLSYIPNLKDWPSA